MCQQSKRWSTYPLCKLALLARMNMRQGRKMVSRVHVLPLLLLSREGGLVCPGADACDGKMQ